MLYLDEARRYDVTSRDKDGKERCLSLYTCDFILQYVFNCMSEAEGRLAMGPKIKD